MVTLPAALPTYQSPPVTSIGSPLREYGVIEVAMTGHFVKTAKPAPNAPLDGKVSQV